MAKEIIKEEVKEQGKLTKAEFEKIIENYKKENPAKYELKKDELAKKLAALK